MIITGEMAGMSDEALQHLQALLSSALPPKRKDVRISRSQNKDKGAREGAAIAALDEFFYHTNLLSRLSVIERMSSDFQNGI